MNVRINFALLILLLLIAVGLGVGVWLLHEFQSPRNGQALLAQADRAEEKGDLSRAVLFLDRYLRFVPQNLEARIRFGQLLDKDSPSPRAKYQVINVFEQVLIHDPQRHDIRRRLAALAVEVGMIDEATAHLQTLQEAFPQDAEVLHQLGRCQEARAQYGQAAALYEEAILHAPDRVESYQRRAYLLRHRLENVAAADELIDQLVKTNPESAPARLARWLYLREFGKPDAAAADVEAALKLAPDQADVRLAAADVAQAKNDPDAARRHLEEGLAKNPRDVRLFHSLAVLEVRQGRTKEAIAVLRRGLEAVPRQPELLLFLGDLLVSNNELEGARAVLEDMRKTNITRFRLVYLDARVKLREGKHAEASAMLEIIRPQATDEPAFTIGLDLLLAQCYETLSDTERQLAAYRRILTLNPTQLDARKGLAAALLNQGRLEEALGEYQRLMTLPQAPAHNWIPLARLMILRNLQEPEARRQWQAVEQVLDQAAKALPDSAHVAVLRGEILVAQGKVSEARQLLEKARAAFPTRSEPWLALVGLAERERQPEKAFDLLDQAQKLLGDRIELLQARLQQAVNRGSEAGLPIVTSLEKKCGSLPAAERGHLLLALGQAYSLLGKPADARRVWQELAALQPTSTIPPTRLFDLALRADDEEGMGQALTALLKIEGPNGLAWQWGEVCRRVWLAQRGDKGQLPEAKRLLSAVAARRTNWPRVAVYRAFVEELEENTQGALEQYLRAVELGDRQPGTIRRAAELLNERQRFAEADALIRKLGDAQLVSGDLQRMSAEAALRAVDHTRALDLARKAVPANSKNYRDHIWMGQMLWAAGHKAEAAAAFQRALDLNSKVPEPWVVLVLYHVAMDQRKEAEAVLEKGQKACTQPVPLAWAQCYEVLRLHERADQFYQEALKTRPDDPVVVRTVTEYCLRTQRTAEARALLRRMLEPQRNAAPADAAWARRGLALLAAEANYQHYREALALLEENFKVNDGMPEDHRARALLLASRPHSRRQAIEILETLYRKVPPTADQQFFLAQVYENDKNLAQARQWLVGALALQGGNPLYLTHYVRLLLVDGSAAEAVPWLERLEKVAPRTFEAVGLRARWLILQGKPAEAVTLMREWIESKEARPVDPATRLVFAASFFEEMGQQYVDHRKVLDPPAEDCYRKHATASSQPGSELALIRYLVRRQRIREALDLCERAWRTSPAEPVAEVCLAALHAAPPSPDQVERVERALRAALEKNPKSPALMLFLADLRDSIQGRYAEAEALYTQLLALDANNVIALNNLAYSLALKGTHGARALEFIQRAIDIAGPAAEFLDTRGMVYLALSQSSQAVKDLEEATLSVPSSTMYFHLAQAHWQARNRPAAVEAWKKAQAAGLEVVALHPIEREAYRKLQGELEAR